MKHVSNNFNFVSSLGLRTSLVSKTENILKIIKTIWVLKLKDASRASTAIENQTFGAGVAKKKIKVQYFMLKQS